MKEIRDWLSRLDSITVRPGRSDGGEAAHYRKLKQPESCRLELSSTIYQFQETLVL